VQVLNYQYCQYIEIIRRANQPIVWLLAKFLIEKDNFRHSLPLEYEASIDVEKEVWFGRARIPASYFPPNITRFNAYAIHGTGDERQ
jgi:hypothetical protein